MALAEFQELPDFIKHMIFGRCILFPENQETTYHITLQQLLLQNLGLIFYLVLVNFMFGVLHFLLIPIGRRTKVGKKLVDKLEAYLYFNGLIKFFMEIFFDVVS